MAIQLNSSIITSQDFVLEGRHLKAVYTPEIDEEFGDLLIDLEALQKKVESKEADELPVDEKKKLIRTSMKKLSDLATNYIKALFNKEDADFIISKSGKRAINLSRMAGTFFKAGNDGEQKNRKQRRAKEA